MNYINTSFSSTLFTSVFPYLAVIINSFKKSWDRIIIRMTAKSNGISVGKIVIKISF